MKKINLDHIKKNYDSVGFVVIKKMYDQKKISKIKKNLFIYLNKDKTSLHNNKIHLAKNTNLINSVHALKWEKINYLKKNTKIKRIISKLLCDNNYKSFGSEVFAKPAKYGMNVPVHQDNYYWNLDNHEGLTVWIALSNSNKKNGAIFYYEGSHKKGLLSHKASYVAGSSQELKNKTILEKFKKTVPNLKIGDVLIHHCLVLHGSDKNNSKDDRTGLTLRFISSRSKINKLRMKKYLSSLKKQSLDLS